MLQPRLVSYVRKRSVAIIFEQMRRRLLPNRKSLQPPSIHQKNIQPSVVVVIVESHPAACRFQQIFIFVLPTKNSFGVQPRLFCNIQKTQSQGTSRNRSSRSSRSSRRSRRGRSEE